MYIVIFAHQSMSRLLLLLPIGTYLGAESGSRRSLKVSTIETLASEVYTRRHVDNTPYRVILHLYNMHTYTCAYRYTLYLYN